MLRLLGWSSVAKNRLHYPRPWHDRAGARPAGRVLSKLSLCAAFGASVVAVVAQSGGDAVEVAVVVSRVAAKLVGPMGWKGGEHLRERGGIELAGGGDGDGAIRGQHAAIA